jgi:hypothetical protein
MKPKIKTDFSPWMREKKCFTVQDFRHKFWISETTIGVILRDYAAKGIIKQEPRTGINPCQWVVINEKN